MKAAQRWARLTRLHRGEGVAFAMLCFCLAAWAYVAVIESTR